MTLNRDECPERIRLTDEYCRAITDFNVRMDALRSGHPAQNPEDWSAAEAARAASQTAWDAVEQHLATHRCMPLSWPGPSGGSLEAAAMHALDAILVADDHRRFVDANEAAAKILGLPRDQIIGRRVDEFFAVARGESIPTAWEAFLADGVRAGVCELISPPKRRFAFRAKANFAPGFHLSLLREVE
jgi:PAS domain-containing protein